MEVTKEQVRELRAVLQHLWDKAAGEKALSLAQKGIDICDEYLKEE